MLESGPRFKHAIDKPPDEIKNPIASSTLEILSSGFYINRKGDRRDIKPLLDYCIANTILYKPDHIHTLPTCPDRAGLIILTREKSLDACYRLVKRAKLEDVVCLNYASARNPGGGFWSMADEQEETLSRASGLWPSIITKKEMYEYNRERSTLLYSDYMILSPNVPVFRDTKYAFLDDPYTVSIITSPAVNAGMVRRRGGEDADKIDEVMLNRIRKVISVAAVGNYKVLILGAWGCCCFRNNPEDIAGHFRRVLVDEGMGKYFDHIVFPIHDYNKERDLVGTFSRVLGVREMTL